MGMFSLLPCLPMDRFCFCFRFRFCQADSFFKDMDRAIDQAKADDQHEAGDVWQWGKIDRDKAVGTATSTLS